MSAQLYLRKEVTKAVYLNPTQPKRCNGQACTKGRRLLWCSDVWRAPPAVNMGTKHTSASPQPLTRRDASSPCVCVC
ncbi:hypothetical protein SKAU_G00205700 [Synaphobranchus kaupii]|uniref:Uncharacterized protein n=1 Tax=Synaphobranchus kaupii TaxID=118154 RepID=A0A9Q1IY96_SYNKA|nr:hypothetical protein SKAU_G00205700 [Synaphobranchus kaupii]